MIEETQQDDENNMSFGKETPTISENLLTSPKDYMEKILSSSRNSETKQQIKNIFKNRDCFTMVRPVTNENQLQNLNSLDNKDLREEFTEQVIELRRKILNNCRTKKFQGTKLNGEQFLNVIEEYIEILNSGSIPSVNNIWSSLCKVESSKAIEIAAKEYEKFFIEKIKENNYKPFDDKALIDNHIEAKKKSIYIFKRNSINREDSFIGELKSKLKEKFSHYNKINEEEVKNEIYKILKRNFEMLEIKLKNKEIKTISQVEEYLNLVEVEIFDSFPETTLRNEMLLDFKLRIMLFASSYYVANFENQIEIINLEKTKNEENSNLELALIKLKSEEESKKKENLILELKSENISIKSEINVAKNTYTSDLNEKSELIRSMQESIQKLKEDNKTESERTKTLLKDLEEEKCRVESSNKRIKADADKDKALLEQKLDYLNRIVEDNNKREKFSGEDLKSQLKEQSFRFKEQAAKYENIIVIVKTEIEILKEKIVDWESVVKNKENLMELEKIKAEELTTKYENDKSMLMEKMSKMKLKLEEENSKISQEAEAKENLYKDKIKQLKLLEEELNEKLENSEDVFKKTKNRMERENLTTKQNNEFLEMKCTELNTRLEEYKNNHNKIISMLDTKINDTNSYSSSQSDFNKKAQEMKTLFDQEKKQIEFKCEKDKETLSKEIKNLAEKLKIKTNSEEEMLKNVEELKFSLEKSNSRMESLQKNKNDFEESTNIQTKEYHAKIKKMNEEFDKLLEEKEKNYRVELSNIHKNSEDALNQVKSLYQIEKLKFEDKIREEKLRQEAKIKILNEENNNLLKETEKEYQIEIDELKDEIIEVEQDRQSYMYNAEYELNATKQKIFNLEAQLKEAKENLDMIEKENIQTNLAKIENLKKEKEDLTNKLEELRIKSDNDKSTLKFKIDSLEKSLQEHEKLTSKERTTREENLKDILNKHELYKSKQQEVIDELSIKKLEYIRETALLKQQIDFLNNKIEDHLKTNEENKKDYVLAINNLKSESEKEISRRIEIISKEKEDLTDKLNKKRKELRDLEQAFLKQTCFVEKDKYSFNDKIRILENDKKEIAEGFMKEIEKISKDTQLIKSNYLKEIEDLHISNDDLKRRIKEMQISYIENEQIFEKEKSLVENKIKLVEKQKDEYKKELIDTQNKVEKIIEAFQKKTNYEKDQLDYVFKEKLNEVDSKYQQYIQEIQENHNSLYSEMVLQNRELEQELKNLSSQAELRNKIITDPNSINKKIKDLIDIQDKLKKELEDAKKEKVSNFSENQFMAEREKEMLKIKIADVEQRLNDVEQKRSFILLEYEKEKARWGLEKDHLHYTIVELQESLDRLQKKGENLLRENEKIKAEKEKDKDSLNKKISSLINSNNLYKEINTPSNMTPTKEFSKSRVYSGRPLNETSSSMAERIDQYNKYEKAEKLVDKNEVNDKYDKYSLNFKDGDKKGGYLGQGKNLK